MEAKTLKGFRDYLPAVMVPRQQMIRAIEATFERQGFVPLQTPALEYKETLTGKYGEEGDKLLYSFRDHGERDVALRYDLTVPLARVVAQHRNELQLPFRRYQVAPVWRADKPQRGRFREFFQCDADIAGANTAQADAEILVTGLAVLQALGVQGAVIDLNHRDVLFGALQAFGVTDLSAQIACIRGIDKLDKMAAADIAQEVATSAALPIEVATQIVAWFNSPQDIASVQAFAPPAAVALTRMDEVMTLVRCSGIPGEVRFRPAIARGLDYYTGIIYETRLTDEKVKGFGAVMSGGRYDGLIGSFGREQVPAVGISLGLDRLLAALQELGLLAPVIGPPVYATVFTETAGLTFAQVQQLRQAGVNAEIDCLGGKLGKQLERAEKRGARLALILGATEAEQGLVLLKDLASREQFSLPFAELTQAVLSRLGPAAK